MNQVLLSRIPILNLDNPLPNEFFSWVLSDIPINYFSSAEFQDDQEIEPFAEDCM